jgi:putative transcriptional regulator
MATEKPFIKGKSDDGPLRRPGRVHISNPADLDVRAIRLNAGSIGCTQERFANAIGVSVKTLRNWEQRRRYPTGPARILLAMIGRDPWLVFDVFNDQHRTPRA